MPKPQSESTGADEHDGLTVETEQRPNALIARFRGQAGLGQERELQRHIEDLIGRKDQVIILDLSRLTYITSVGITALMRLKREVTARGAELRLAGLVPPVSTTMHHCKLDQLFPSYPSVEDAVK